MKRDVVALWLSARDPRTPWYAKLTAGFVAAYALSPIDLVPDFIPIIGYLDDLLIVPLGIMAAVSMIPAPLMAEFRLQAAGRMQRPTSYFGMLVMAATWLVALVFAAYMLWPRHSS